MYSKNELDILMERLEVEKDIIDSVYCVIEEMSEVTKVLTKYLRGSHKFSIDKLTEEIAHALMMLTTIKNMFSISDEDIKNEQLKALKKYFELN